MSPILGIYYASVIVFRRLRSRDVNQSYELSRTMLIYLFFHSFVFKLGGMNNELSQERRREAQKTGNSLRKAKQKDRNGN